MFSVGKLQLSASPAVLTDDAAVWPIILPFCVSLTYFCLRCQRYYYYYCRNQ